MTKYNVEWSQKEYGFTEIEANSPDEAKELFLEQWDIFGCPQDDIVDGGLDIDSVNAFVIEEE